MVFILQNKAAPTNGCGVYYIDASGDIAIVIIPKAPGSTAASTQSA